jgi:hypothetical protein
MRTRNAVQAAVRASSREWCSEHASLRHQTAVTRGNRSAAPGAPTGLRQCALIRNIQEGRRMRGLGGRNLGPPVPFPQEFGNPRVVLRHLSGDFPQVRTHRFRVWPLGSSMTASVITRISDWTSAGCESYPPFKPPTVRPIAVSHSYGAAQSNCTASVRSNHPLAEHTFL